jgi:hypothetical protein
VNWLEKEISFGKDSFNKNSMLLRNNFSISREKKMKVGTFTFTEHLLMDIKE